MRKADEYAHLVATRKACHRCSGLTNPADIEEGCFDGEHIGAWSAWQGNLDAAVMVVGQDWGDAGYFVRWKGQDWPHNPTNLALVELLDIAGVSVGASGSAVGRNIAFFTNAILCLKDAHGGLQGKVERSWFSNCASFLRRQIEIVNPLVVVGLGQRAYQTILDSFGLTGSAFRAEVEDPQGKLLPNGTRAFAMYHCGAIIRNTHRPMEQQHQDWRRIRPFLKRND